MGKADKKIWLIGTPEFGNLGDHKISETEWEILLSMYPRQIIHEITMNEYWECRDKLQKSIGHSDILVFHGGGNVGNLWPKSEYIRRNAFQTWREQKKIIMPQSICFTDDEEGKKELELTKKVYSVPNLILACRDENSYRFAEQNLPCRSILTPDTVMFHKPHRKWFIKQYGVVVCLRDDKEKALSDKDVQYIVSLSEKKFENVKRIDTVGEKQTKNSRSAALEKFMDQIRHAELVITDRLHCMIFCALEGVPCIALDNNYNKIAGGYQWLKNLEYIEYIQDMKKLESRLGIARRHRYRYPVKEYRKLFEPLLRELRGR